MKTHPLSSREFEIAQFTALGQSKKEIAERTFRSIRTIETTIKNIYAKLGLNKLSDLTLWYCGQVFGIAEQIAVKKKEILAALIALLVCIEISLDSHADLFRLRRRARRRYDIESVYTEYNISA